METALVGFIRPEDLECLVSMSGGRSCGTKHDHLDVAVNVAATAEKEVPIILPYGTYTLAEHFGDMMGVIVNAQQLALRGFKYVV
jgi:hypothetical protein